MNFPSEKKPALTLRCDFGASGKWLLVHDRTPRFAAAVYQSGTAGYLESQLLWCEEPISSISPELHEAADHTILRALCHEHENKNVDR